MLLDHAIGYVKPGQMVAIMGPSGSGAAPLLVRVSPHLIALLPERCQFCPSNGCGALAVQVVELYYLRGSRPLAVMGTNPRPLPGYVVQGGPYGLAWPRHHPR